MKQNPISLQQLKTQMLTDAQKRDAVVEQGARAYRLGIEKNGCMVNEPSARQLWNEGWDKAQRIHVSSTRRGGTMGS